jgi:hypothetical protein
MATSRTYRQVFGANGTNFIQGGRISPDVDEFLFSYVATGQGKLHAGKNVAIGSDVGCRVTGTARISFHDALVGRGRGGTEFLYIPHEVRIVKNSIQL